MVITVIPISIGMLIRKYKTSFANRMEKPMRIASTVIFLLVFIAVVAANFNLIGNAMKEVGLVTLLLNILTMGLGFLTAKLFKQYRNEHSNCSIFDLDVCNWRIFNVVFWKKKGRNLIMRKVIIVRNKKLITPFH